MPNLSSTYRIIENGGFDGGFKHLYPAAALFDCRTRYKKAVSMFDSLYGGDRNAVIVSAPGRAEIIGNHTDHQYGRVLAAAVDLDILCVAAANGKDTVRIKSEGYPEIEADISDISPQTRETGTPACLVRGCAAWFKKNGYAELACGFDAYMTSDVLPGSGLSSSAAFETALCNIWAALAKTSVSPIDIAKAGQYAENFYMNKPSGLMDQIACSLGGLIYMDFYDIANPVTEKIPFDLKQYSLNMCVTDTKGSHEGLSAEYAAIPSEMHAVAAVFGESFLSRVNSAEFFANIKRVRDITGDRAMLRAVHFFDETERVKIAAKSAKLGNIGKFLKTIHSSGLSSVMNLQNISTGDPKHQGIAAALTVSEKMLKSKGASRVHGGGFAGTVLAFVPDNLLDEYKTRLNAVFGGGAVKILNIRQAGGYCF